MREEYRRLTGETLAAVKQTPPAPGKDEVLVPGEPEIRSRAAREREGIPIPDPIWQDLAKSAPASASPCRTPQPHKTEQVEPQRKDAKDTKDTKERAKNEIFSLGVLCVLVVHLLRSGLIARS